MPLDDFASKQELQKVKQELAEIKQQNQEVIAVSYTHLTLPTSDLV
nr:hypothetical protein [Klebsiella pneumoniae]